MRLQRLAAFIFVIEATAVFASAQYLSFNFSSCNNESLSDEVMLRAILWQQNASLANITFLADGRWIIKNEQKQWRLGALNVITFSNDESDNRTLSLRSERRETATRGRSGPYGRASTAAAVRRLRAVRRFGDDT